MKKTKKIITLALTVAMLVGIMAGLSACGGDKTPTDEFIYVPEYIKLTGDLSDGVNNICYSGGMIYYSGSRQVDANGNTVDYNSINANYKSSVSATGGTVAVEGGTVVSIGEPAGDVDISGETRYVTEIYSLDLEGKSTRLFEYKPSEIPEGMEGSSYMASFNVDAQGNVYVIENSYIYQFDLPAGFDESSGDRWQYMTNSVETYSLIKFDKDGNELSRTNLTELCGADKYFYNFACDKDGNCVLPSDQTVYVIAPDGTLAYSFEVSGWINSAITMADGTVAILQNGESGGLFTVDNKTKSAVKLCDMPYNAYNLSPGMGEFGCLYTNGVYLYGVDTATGAETKILNWISCDIDNNYISGVTLLEDGRVACVTNNYDSETTGTELAILTKTKNSPENQKKVITLACQYLDYDIKSKIIKFNKTNNEYRIDVTDYSEYNTEEDYEAGLKKMNTEILSGNVPDIIYTQGVNVEQLAAKGLLEPLDNFLENDKDLSKEDLVPSVLKVMEIDGKLYETSSSFGIYTVMGNSDLVGEKPGWTVPELQEAFAKMPEGATILGDTLSRTDILTYSLAMDMSSFVDWSTGNCNFDSQGFRDLLEFANSFPSEIDWENYDWQSAGNEYERVASGKQMLMMSYLYSFDDYRYASAAFGDKITFKGFPTNEGVGNMMILTSGFAISSKCQNKDGAWQFVRQFLLAEQQEKGYYGFPTNQKAFDAMIKEVMTPVYRTDENGNFVLDENGDKIEESQGGMSYGNGQMVEFYAMTQEQIDKIMDVINSTTKRMNMDNSINEIITEEAAAYFSGQKPAEEVSKLVQSRVSIYVQEQS